GASAETFTAGHVAKLRAVSSAAMSPDGAKIAYTVSVPRKPFQEDDGPPWVELHVAASEAEAKPFVTGEVTVSDVQWKPDGRSITFLGKRGKDKTKCLYEIAVDGGEARNVLAFDTDISEYSWSPDGTRVAFVAAEKEEKAVKERKEKGFKHKVYEEDYDKIRL